LEQAMNWSNVGHALFFFGLGAGLHIIFQWLPVPDQIFIFIAVIWGIVVLEGFG
jgi:hypothetical protein